MSSASIGSQETCEEWQQFLHLRASFLYQYRIRDKIVCKLYDAAVIGEKRRKRRERERGLVALIDGLNFQFLGILSQADGWENSGKLISLKLLYSNTCVSLCVSLCVYERN